LLIRHVRRQQADGRQYGKTVQALEWVGMGETQIQGRDEIFFFGSQDCFLQMLLKQPTRQQGLMTCFPLLVNIPGDKTGVP
jgi:hypothetical protein